MPASADGLLEMLADLVAERVAKRLAIDGRERKPSKALPDFYSEVDLEKRTGIPRRTWQGWRYKGGGPPVVKAGRRRLYPRLDFEQWLEGRRKGTTHSRPA